MKMPKEIKEILKILKKHDMGAIISHKKWGIDFIAPDFTHAMGLIHVAKVREQFFESRSLTTMLTTKTDDERNPVLSEVKNYIG